MEKYKLIKPIGFGEERFEEIKLREPKAKHLTKYNVELPTAESTTVSYDLVVRLVRACCDAPDVVVDEMSTQDLGALYQVCTKAFFA